MRDWKTLLATRGFRSLWFALVSDGLETWCVVATLPIMVAERFGSCSIAENSASIFAMPLAATSPNSAPWPRTVLIRATRWPINVSRTFWTMP